jgi:hypothetical protein
VEWTDSGEPAVKGKRFKFFSSVYDPEKCEKVGTRTIRNRTYPLVRPLELDRLALTNDPNNKGGKPISNRNGGDAGAGNNETQPNMKNVNNALGLAEDAPETSSVAEIQKIKNRATSAETERDALKKERDDLLAAQVESDLEKYKNRFKAENREKVKAQLIKNRAGTIELLEATAPAETEQTTERQRITNRGTAKSPKDDPNAAETEKAEQRAAKISNRARQIRAQNPKTSLNDAYATATAEIDADVK